jgi:hypothetical protein
LAALAVAALLLPLACSKSEQQKQAEEQARMAAMTPVTPDQAAKAAARVEHAWQLVRDKVKTAYSPDAEALPFYMDLAVLTRHPHRLAGYGRGQEDAPGSIYAANYVADRLMAMGFEYVQTQDFPVVQPVTAQCELVVDGQSYPIFATRPNILQAPITPVEGITGPTVYVGAGEVADYGENYVKDKIVVMDFDCRDNWLYAFSFGARAVLFVGGDRPASKPYHHVNLPANFPRFFVPKDLAARLALTGESKEVKILAACEWRQVQGRNVVAVIRGTYPRFVPDRPDEAIVLAAPLDSLSEVPLLSPGAREAANCAALLKIADELRKNPPKRDTFICFFDAQAQNHMGARAFYGSMYRRLAGRELAEKNIEERLARLDDERQYLFQVKDVLDRVTPLAEIQGQWSALDQQRAELGPEVARLAERKAELTESRKALQDRKPSEDNKSATEQMAAIDDELSTLEARIKPLDDRLRDVNAGLADLDSRMSQPDLAATALFSEDTYAMPRHQSAVQFLRDEAKNFDSDILDTLRPLRVENRPLPSGDSTQARIDNVRESIETMRADLARKEGELKALPEGSKERQELAKQIANLQAEIAEYPSYIPRLERQKLFEDRDMGWNALMGELFKRALTPATRGRFARLVEESSQTLDQRLAELDVLTERANNDLVFRNTIGPDKNDVVLHVGVDLGDGRDSWTFVHGDNSGPLGDDRTGNYSTVFRVMRSIHKTGGDKYRLFDARAVSESYDNRLFCPTVYADSTAVASIFAIHNISAMASLDRLPRDGLPGDTLEALKPRRIYAQASELGPFLRDMSDNAGLVLTPQYRAPAVYVESDWSSNKPGGPSVKQAGAGSAMPDRPVRGAVVAMLRYNALGIWAGGDIQQSPPGFQFPLYVMTDTNGIFEVPPHDSKTSTLDFRSARTFVATFDKTPVGDQEIPDEYVTRGLITSVVDTTTFPTDAGQLPNKAVHLFQTRCKSIVGFGYDRGAIASVTMRAKSTAKFRDDRHLLCEAGTLLTLYAPFDAEGMKVFCKTGSVLLNNEPNKDEYQGEGVSLSDQFDHPVAVDRSARDLLTLNSYRLKLLRNSRINHESLERLNGEANDIRADAEAMIVHADGDKSKVVGLKSPWQRIAAGMGASDAISRLTYNPLTGVMKDLVTAVVLLLLLAMPFAYALERLLVGTPHIYRQIGWFAAFFLATFAVLFLVNPAFQIAATPIIIFLAFTIILLSSLVIFILVRKLQAEIKKMQGLGTTVHSADVSRLSTMAAAVGMGISTMRRRPVRTLLTAITVVLLTFTILTFASFGSSWGIRKSYEGPVVGAPYRVLIRHQLWSPIGNGVLDTVAGHLSAQGEVVARYWVSPTAQQAKDIQENTRDSMDFLISCEKTDKIVPISAAEGLDVRDVERQPHLKDLFHAQDSLGKPVELARLELLDKGVILTDALSRELGLTGDDIGKTQVLVKGVKLIYAGMVSDRIGSFELCDGSSILPVDYQASAGSSVDTFAETSTTQSLSEMPDVESAQFVNVPMDQVVFVSPDTARLMGGQVRAITVYPNKDEQVYALGETSAKLSELPAYACGRAGVTRMIFTSLAEASGARDLLVPVLLGGMIIFATMLGSVSDREREIYTFSSLGLAPAHVASLFFAEAAIYAVVGGMGGYLLGQVVARLLGYLAALGWMSVPSMNYSSTNAIVTVLIVMGTVLISTIYPAMKASRSANPGIQRSWKIPHPKGDLYDLMFPFTVSAYDIIGVVSFLKEHFDNYSDTSLGVFASMSAGIFRQTDNDMLGFKATVALAPFDLGVTQNFALLSQPSEIEGIDEVRILIYRLSGAQGDWQRSNRVFINELRKQLLIWRSLPQDVMDRYRQSTNEAWNDLPVEQIDQQSIGGSA